jgi:two-component system NtrC family sensor kinase
MSEHERLTGIIAAQRDIIRLELDAKAMHRIVVDRAMSLTEATGSGVHVHHGDETVYNVAGSLVGHDDLRLTPRAGSEGEGEGEATVCTDSLRDDSVDQQACLRMGVRSLVIVPLLHGRRRVGVLQVVHSAPDAFSDRDVDTLEILAGFVSEVMSRASEIRARELKFHAFMSNCPIAAFLKDPAGRFVFLNSAYERLMGAPAESVLGKTCSELYPPELAERMAARDELVLSTGPVEAADSGIVGGVLKTCLSVMFPVADASGQMAIGGMLMDVSSRVGAEEALRASEHRFRSLAEYASDAVISVDAAGRIVFWNHSAVRVFGYDATEAIGRSVATILTAGGDEAQSVLGVFAARAAAHEASSVELRARRKNGSDFPVEVSVSTWMSGDERFFTAILRDVTERKLIQEQLSHATRLISIGTLASGIGHEINNPLSYVMYNLEFASDTIQSILDEANGPKGISQESLQKLAPLRDDLIEASNGADRIRAILRDLRTFSRAGDERKLPTSVSRAADAAINMVFSQIRHHARVVKVYEDTSLVDAVEGKLVQVIVNLLVNAAQSMAPERPEENTIRVRTAMAGDSWVVLEVSDTGAGIPASDLSRIFDPFYTTKAVGSGTGLGLSISHGIVQSFGGTIEVDTELGQGSTFRVRLPASPREARSSQRPRTGTSPPVRRGRVMVIDDEPQVSASLQRMLAKEHDVVAHTSSRAAARELRTGARYDLILCDLMMPDLPGWQLYTTLSEEQKGLVVFMTGGAFQPPAREFLAGIKNPVLDKPVDPRQLRALLRERLTA